MHMRIHVATLVPRCQQHSATPTTMLHVFQRVHHVGDEAEKAGQEARHAGPDTDNRG